MDALGVLGARSLHRGGAFSIILDMNQKQRTARKMYQNILRALRSASMEAEKAEE